MNVKIATLAFAVGGACFVTSVSALPIANVLRDTIATKVRDDDAGGMTREIIHGLGGHSGHRDRDHDRHHERDRDHDRHHERDRDHDRHHERDRDHDRHRD